MRIEARPFIAPCYDPPPAVAPDATAPATRTESLDLERVKLAKRDVCPAPKPAPAPTPPKIPVGSSSSGVVVGVLRGIGSFFAGLFSARRCVTEGVGDAARALLSGEPRRALSSLGHAIGGAILGAALHTAGGVVLALRKGGRPLSQDEAATLRKALGPKVRTDLLRIVEGGSFLNAKNAAITIGHTIFVAKNMLPLAKDLLVHEATHTVQFDEIGASYLSRALLAQHDGDGYDFRKAIARGESFAEMNLESQAEFRQQLELAGWDPATAPRVWAAPDGHPPSLSLDPAAFGGSGSEVTASVVEARGATAPAGRDR